MKKSRSIIFCTIVIFITCLSGMKLLFNAKWYWYVFQYLPADVIMMRYLTSWLGRILLIIAGIGIWQLKNWGRNLAVIILTINILTLPWKHPTMAIQNSITYDPGSARLMQGIHSIFIHQEINLIALTSTILIAWDFVLNATLIFLLTRKKVKKI